MRINIGLVAAAALLTGKASGAQHPPSPRPKAAVVVVIDQMRGDYVRRFAPFFTGGLKRIMTEGTVFDSASHEHANTETAVGHATLSTGCYPSHHGIVGNDFYDRSHDQIVYAVEDTTTRLLRTTIAPLKREDSLGSSAHYLLRSSIANWVKKADRRNLVFSVSLKDRAAILMAGQSDKNASPPDAVYWWDRKTGDFVTSTAYADSLPEWVNRYNRSGAKDNWKDSVWNRYGDTSQYRLIGPDSANLENDGIHTAFPHAFTTERSNRTYYDALYYTPYADQLLIKFARELIGKERPGTTAGFDLLMISCSAADAVGHSYGPMSQEVFDYYLRVDGCLDTLLHTLDSTIGRDNYVVALSSDHGCADIPADTNRVLIRDYDSSVLALFKELEPGLPYDLRRDSLLEFLGADVIVRRKELSSPDSPDLALLTRVVANELVRLPSVFAPVVELPSLELNLQSIVPIQLFRNNACPGRMPDITVVLRPNWILTSGRTGTTHGSPYWYDRHVPMAFWGNGISAQHIPYRVRTVDMAPTLAELIGIPPPDSIDGKSLFPLTTQ